MWTSRAISVMRTPGSGRMPNRLSTATWVCPPPISTRSLTTGTVWSFITGFSTIRNRPASGGPGRGPAAFDGRSRCKNAVSPSTPGRELPPAPRAARPDPPGSGRATAPFSARPPGPGIGPRGSMGRPTNPAGPYRRAARLRRRQRPRGSMGRQPTLPGPAPPAGARAVLRPSPPARITAGSGRLWPGPASPRPRTRRPAAAGSAPGKPRAGNRRSSRDARRPRRAGAAR